MSRFQLSDQKPALRWSLHQIGRAREARIMPRHLVRCAIAKMARRSLLPFSDGLVHQPCENTSAPNIAGNLRPRSGNFNFLQFEDDGAVWVPDFTGSIAKFESRIGRSSLFREMSRYPHCAPTIRSWVINLFWNLTRRPGCNLIERLFHFAQLWTLFSLSLG